LNLLVFFALLQFVESKFIMPKLIGDRMDLHPAIVIITLLVGAEFFGLLGMFLAAPAAAIIRVLVRYYLIKPRKMHVWGLPGPEDGGAAETAPAEPEPAASSSPD
jgi:predicted PurR-regulated permease PerM